MAVASERKRVQVTLSKKVLEEIDKLCAESGMSRSAWIEYTLTMGIHSYDKLISGLSQAMAQAGAREQP
jgi:metal-responsive CopG/Arc/MetJ family transcriptional regulator